MRENRILHKSQLENFIQFIDDKAFYILKTTVAYEVLRFKTDLESRPGIVYKNKTQYLTCNDIALPFAKMFLKEKVGK